MAGELYRFLADDHDRLDSLLERASAAHGNIDLAAFEEFRKGILRHIGMEEKTILPTITKLRGGQRPAVADRLRRDHGAIVALLVPLPSPTIAATLRSILIVHNQLEEEEGGLYDLFEALVGTGWEEQLEQLKSTPDVPVLPHNGRPEILDATRRAVERAGYRMAEK